jgi:hypothetical protein
VGIEELDRVRFFLVGLGRAEVLPEQYPAIPGPPPLDPADARRPPPPPPRLLAASCSLLTPHWYNFVALATRITIRGTLVVL